MAIIPNLPNYVFENKHNCFIFLKTEEFLLSDSSAICIFEETIHQIIGNDPLSFLDINNTSVFFEKVSLKDYSIILKNMYTNDNDGRIFKRYGNILQPSPYLYFKTEKCELEYFADSLLDIGIIGCSKDFQDLILLKFKEAELLEKVWGSSFEYLEYLKHRFTSSGLESFKICFLNSFKSQLE